jgi:hypothetical protein
MLMIDDNTPLRQTRAIDPKQQPLIEELADNLTEEEIRQLAVALPYDIQSAEYAAQFSYSAIQPIRLREDVWLACCVGPWQSDKNPTLKYPALKLPILLRYVVAASRQVVCKALEEMVELAKQKLAVLNRMNTLFTLINSKKIPKLKEYAKHGTKALQIVEAEERTNP